MLILNQIEHIFPPRFHLLYTSRASLWFIVQLLPFMKATKVAKKKHTGLSHAFIALELVSDKSCSTPIAQLSPGWEQTEFFHDCSTSHHARSLQETTAMPSLADICQQIQEELKGYPARGPHPSTQEHMEKSNHNPTTAKLRFLPLPTLCRRFHFQSSRQARFGILQKSVG